MCGITGIWNQKDDKLVEQMVRSVAHRGPDGLDCLVMGNCGIGASRLAIMGNPAASAIYHDPLKRLAVMLNGEIYNIDMLRHDLLDHGCIFETDMETEVIAKLYQCYGTGFAERLKGMFAVVIVDNDKLILSRDRFGIKPLYYYDTGSKVIFGSEIKSLLVHPDISPRLNISALEEIAIFGYVHSPVKTLFQDIVSVEPGSVIVFSGMEKSTIKYFIAPESSFFSPDIHMDYSSAVKKLRGILIETVALHLNHGDHHVGIYLSGGLDSTILTFIAKNILDYPVTTFTMSDGNENADLLAARKVASRLGTRHIEHSVCVDDYFNELPHFIKHYESLIAGGVFDIHGGIAFHLLSKIVSDHVKVAFSGEGADELFGGYYWPYTHPLGFSDCIGERTKLISNGNGIYSLVDSLFPEPEDEKIYQLNIFNALLRGGLSNYHLQSVDRSAGAYGFEIRPVYLYDDLAKFAISLPIEYKIQGKMITKRILRDAFKPELDKLGLGFVLTRPKEGMPAAVSNIAPLISRRIESLIDDSELLNHPLRNYLRTKMDIYFFNIFAKTFMPGVDIALQNCTAE